MNRNHIDWLEIERIELPRGSAEIPRADLMRLIFDTAGHFPWRRPEHDGAVPMPVLRSVLLYCLARNICAAEEIVESASSDAGVSYLCAGHILEWQDIHEFRRRNSETVRQALTELFAALSIPRAAAHEAAVQRLRRAIQQDSIVLDF